MLTVNDKYFRHYSRNLELPIQVQLSKKFKTFSCLFIAFSQSSFNFEHCFLQKNFIGYSFLVLLAWKDLVT